MRFLWTLIFLCSLFSAYAGDESASALKEAAKNNDKLALLNALNAGAPLDSRYSNGWTALHLAAYKGYEDIALILIEKGADINAKDKSSASPIHYALLEHQTALICLLIDKSADLNSGTYTGETALHYAMLPGNKEFALKMIRKGADCTVIDRHGRSPLHSAPDSEIAALLIEKGAPVNLKDKDGWTPVYNAVADSEIDLLRLYISMGADLNSPVSLIEGYTLVHIAVFAENPEALGILLKNGACHSMKDKSGQAPLDYARKLGSPELIKQLEDASQKER